jgi:hypothetical protein
MEAGKAKIGNFQHAQAADEQVGRFKVLRRQTRW